MQNGKKLQLQVLVDISFEVFNADNTKNREVIRFALLEVKINKHKEQINVAVTDLNRTDMFLGHNWLVKHNLDVIIQNLSVKVRK